MPERLENRLVNKSIEAFILGIEIYNKPTIKYRVEGFSFFICNAWELLLKAYLVKCKGDDSIYYSDNPDRTLSLNRCIKDVFTNDKDPLRINLETIIDLRNISTHFITEEYEQIYIPLFQSCVLNYSNKLADFFNIDISTHIPQNFLTLSINIDEITETTIKAKYPRQIADKILKATKEINRLSSEHGPRFSISITHDLHLTKNKKHASAEFRLSESAEDAAFIIKDIRDPKETHKYTTGKCVDILNKWIERDGLAFQSLSPAKGKDNTFNAYHFRLFTDFYNLKSDIKYCYEFNLHSQPTFTYSQATINLIYSEIKKDPENIIQHLKDKINKS
ncbi:conserved protein of unknown function [Tepidanaerobacter acetatoxydans Re1]|uniref:Uncharacterized protein n=1 Tax=Tepidanaerobacter acetatoxydans (strain DSM 21804 / JCM 16047 / Re1) TaxID=1209989 RepID=F4LRV0_TEPAE|nr:DUF3644 domain-containing protein [Tepidanaerobacter acetatoxydans]AEE91168.1 hypothetical protein TepRe1_1020 [Tepidanaerobacter acetatoxydans Re1]CDI40580.1 conserved protein of unknown function [Tepidanaerobacter acetatoxydans Re1]